LCGIALNLLNHLVLQVFYCSGKYKIFVLWITDLSACDSTLFLLERRKNYKELGKEIELSF